MTTCNLNAFIFKVLCVLGDPSVKERCVVIDGFSQLPPSFSYHFFLSCALGPTLHLTLFKEFCHVLTHITEYVSEIIQFVKKIIKNGYVYVVSL